MALEEKNKQEIPVNPEEMLIQNTDVSLLSEEENKGIGYEIIANLN